METTYWLHPDQWAEQPFGQAGLGDRRRPRRAVKAAGGMVRDPAASLPQAHQTWKDVKAVYRWLDEPAVTFEALLPPHWQQTRPALPGESVVLLVQETTEMDRSAHGRMTGLGPIGTGQGRGFLLPTLLAVGPERRAVMGWRAQRPFLRVPAPGQEQRSPRRHRASRETDGGMQLVKQVGTPACAGLLVPVGDRGADLLPFFRRCLATQPHLLVRAAQTRRVQAHEAAIGQLLDQVRAWPSLDPRPFDGPARHGRHARQPIRPSSFGPAILLPPWNDPRGRKEPRPVWVVRVWESDPPEGAAALEWILLTSLSTATGEHAWLRVEW